jgi:hypothetical protein
MYAHVFRKENDEYCETVINHGGFFLYHNVAFKVAGSYL